MKERGILFSGPMVRAILKGRKTMTRRVVKPQQFSEVERYETYPDGSLRAIVWSHDECGSIKCPYGAIGDRLWVRETHCYICKLSEGPRPVSSVAYRADRAEGQKSAFDGQWRPSIYMPRWASRITLEVTGVRVERLHAIGEQDAVSEGVTWPKHEDFKPLTIDGFTSGPARIAFKELWSNINGAASWHRNPWVWVVEFRRV